MRDSLNAGPPSRRGERSSRQKRLTPSEMPIAPAKKKDQGRARGASPPGQQQPQRKSTGSRPRRTSPAGSRKRPRASTQMGAAGSRLQRADPSVSPLPPRKRGRPTAVDDQVEREKDGGRSSSRRGREQRGTLTSTGSCTSLRRNGRTNTSKNNFGRQPDPVPAMSSSSSCSSRSVMDTDEAVKAATPVVSSISLPGALEAVVAPPPPSPSITVSSDPSWPFQHQPQRLTRKRPVDQDKMMKVFIGHGPASSSSNSRRDGRAGSNFNSSTPTFDRKEAAQEQHASSTEDSSRANAKTVGSTIHNRRTVRASVRDIVAEGRHGSSCAAASFSRQHVARSNSAGSRGQCTKRGTPSGGTAAVASSNAVTLAEAEPSRVESKKDKEGCAPAGESREHVIVPQFRLHNLFGSGESNKISADRRETRAPGVSGGARRRRPAGKATAKQGAGAIAPPHPRGTSDDDVGFLELTKDSLVRSSRSVFGSDYDMDDEDGAFLEKLNSSAVAGCDGALEDPSSKRGRRGSLRSDTRHSRSGEERGAISADLFEAMIERLERQEARARDSMVLMESSLRLKQEHDDAAKRVTRFIEEADGVLASCRENSVLDTDIGSRWGGIGRGLSRVGSGGDVGSNGVREASKGSDSDGSGSGSVGSHGRRCGGSGSSASTQRRKKKGYADEEESDSDDDEHQARILRSRGPVILSESFAVPLLRSCVMASREVACSNGGREAGISAGATKGKGWKGKEKSGTAAAAAASTTASVKARSSESDLAASAAELPDKKLAAVYKYWAKKREAYGGPMLRCFHPFMMRLWRRMDDPVREAEDQEEGRDPHASLEAFDTLKSFRQDLDKARLLVDCVKRREKLKRSGIRFADVLWKIMDSTVDAPRAAKNSSSAASSTAQRKLAPPPPPSDRPSTRGRPSDGTRSSQNVSGGNGEGREGSSNNGKGVRSRGRAAATAARAAAAAIATAEAFQEKEDSNESSGDESGAGGQELVEQSGDTDHQQAREGRAKRNAKSNTGCAEQEQGWNSFAQLPRLGEERDGYWPASGRGSSIGMERVGGAEGSRGVTPRQSLFVYRGQEIVDDGLREAGHAEATTSTSKVGEVLTQHQRPSSSREGETTAGAHHPDASTKHSVEGLDRSPTSDPARTAGASEAPPSVPEEELNDRERRRLQRNARTTASIKKREEAREKKMRDAVDPTVDRSRQRKDDAGDQSNARQAAHGSNGRTSRSSAPAPVPLVEAEIDSKSGPKGDLRRGVNLRRMARRSRPDVALPPLPEEGRVLPDRGRGTKRRRSQEAKNHVTTTAGKHLSEVVEEPMVPEPSGRATKRVKNARASRSVVSPKVEEVPAEEASLASTQRAALPKCNGKRVEPPDSRKTTRSSANGRGNRALACLS